MQSTNTIPEKYRCLLTGKIMVEPVTASDGHIYELEALLTLFNTQNPKSPKTDELLDTSIKLIVNQYIKEDITKFLRKNSWVNINDIYLPKSLIQNLLNALKSKQEQEALKYLAQDERLFSVELESGKTVCELSCDLALKEVIKLLLTKKPEFLNHFLLTACREQNLEALERLLNLGASVGPLNEDNETALHIAAGLSWEAGCACLLEYGADVYAKDKQGQYPFTFAVKAEMKGINENENTSKIKEIDKRITQEFYKLITNVENNPAFRNRDSIDSIKSYLSINPNLYSDRVENLLLAAINASDWNIRYAAVGAIGNILNPNAEVINALAHALKDSYASVQSAASEALGKLTNRSIKVVNTLIELLKDPDLNMQNGAFEALKKLSNPSTEAIDTMMKALKSGHWNTQWAAVQVLIKLPNPRMNVIDIPLRLLRHEQPAGRLAAVQTLSNLINPSDDVVDALIGALKDTDPGTRQAAIKTLGKLPNPSDKVFDALILALKDNDSSVQQAAAQALGKLPNPSNKVIDTLIQVLNDTDSWVQQAAAQALGKLPNPSNKVIDALIETLKDVDWSVGSAAADALSNIPNPSDRIIDILIKASNYGRDSHVRFIATKALGNLSNPSDKVIDALMQALNGSTLHIRGAAVTALGKLPNPSAYIINALIKSLQDPTESVRIDVIQTLGNLSNPSMQVIHILIQVLNTATPHYTNLPAAAAKALGQLPNPSEKIIDLLIQALKHSDWHVTKAAIEGLGKLTNPSNKVIDALVQELKHPDWHVIQAAIEGLGKLTNRSDKVIDALIEALRNNGYGVAQAAAETLIQLRRTSYQVPTKTILEITTFLHESLLLRLTHQDEGFFTRLDTEHNDVLAIAIQNGQVGLAQWLLDHNIPVLSAETPTPPYLFQAVSLGSPTLTQLLVERFPEQLSQQNQENETPLLLAARLGFLPVMQILLEAGADYEVHDKENRSLIEILKFYKHPTETIVSIQKFIDEHNALKQLISAPQITTQMNQHYQTIAYSELTLEPELIGEGGYGEIYKATWHDTTVAVKQLKFKKLSPDLRANFEREAQIMAQSDFLHVVHLYGACTQTPPYALVMEYCEKGSLSHLLQDTSEALPWVPHRWQLAIGMLAGLNFLHSKNILHRDLSSQNVLVDAYYRAKIGDFGQSKIKAHTATLTTNVKSNIRWKAPELYQDGVVNTKASDMFSVGVVLWEIASRRLPFAGYTDAQVIQKVLQQHAFEPLPSDCPPALADIIRACWTTPDKRPSASQVLKQLRDAYETAASYQLILEKKPWHVAVKPTKNHPAPFQLIPAAPEDTAKVLWAYQQHPVFGMEIKDIQVIINPSLEQVFEARLKTLEQRATQSIFKSRWQAEVGVPTRESVHRYAQHLSLPYKTSDYPNVQIMPLWHGTSTTALNSLCATGFANLALTDKGFFGKGIYGAVEAEYAQRIYGKDALLLSWFSYHSAYPVIDGDEARLEGKGNYENYDAHVIPVVPHSKSASEKNFYPLKHAHDLPHATEFVVFEASQALPRYQVILSKPTVAKPLSLLGQTPYGLFRTKESPINLYDAARFVYETYLSKPYTLKSNATDWEYRYELFFNEWTSIQRPNHGLAHTLRTAFYVPFVIKAYLEHQKNQLTPDDIRLLQNHERILQLALLFYVTGRENESGHEAGPAYQRFRKNSAKYFLDFVQKEHPHLNEALKNACKTAIEQGYYLPQKHIVTDILCLCHDLDTLRCFDKNKFETSVLKNDLVRLLGEQNSEQLIKLATRCIQMTGDRLTAVDAIMERTYHGPRYIICSQQVATCFHYLEIAEREWNMSISTSLQLGFN